jgi:hypothetical protein
MVRAGRDEQIVDLSEEWACRYWCGQFGVSRENLERAIAAVGNRADAIRDYVDHNFVVSVRYGEVKGGEAH